MISYVDSINSITAERLNGFFVGWKKPPSPETHLQLLKNSDYVILAIDDKSDRIVGFITAISDRVLSAYIPFLEVLPHYQYKGIGPELVRRMLEKLADYYMIDLTCDTALQKFYAHFGMIPNTGMMIRNFNRQSGELGVLHS